MVVLVVPIIVRIGRGIGWLVGAVEGVCEGAVGRWRLVRTRARVARLVGMRCRHRRRGFRILRRVSGEADWIGTYRDAILSVVDAPAVGEDVDIGALGAEFAVSLRWLAGAAGKGCGVRGANLCKVLANRLRGLTQLVTKGTGVAGLAGALSEELAGHVRGIWTMSAAGNGTGNEAIEQLMFRSTSPRRVRSKRRAWGDWGGRTRRTSGAFEAGRRHARIALAAGDVEAARSHVAIVRHRGRA